jgi:hypothetical protein
MFFLIIFSYSDTSKRFPVLRTFHTEFGTKPANYSVDQRFFYSPTDEQLNCLKNKLKIYIKIDIKTAPTCFSAVTPSSWSALLMLAKVTVVKIAN